MNTILGQKCLILNKDHTKCLLLQRSDYAQDPFYRDMIGGGVKYGEDVIPALQREAMEEAQITLINPKPIHTHARMLEPEKWFHFTLWVCDSYDGDITLSEEHIGYQRVDKATLQTLQLRETVQYVLDEIMEQMR